MLVVQRQGTPSFPRLGTPTFAHGIGALVDREFQLPEAVVHPLGRRSGQSIQVRRCESLEDGLTVQWFQFSEIKVFRELLDEMLDIRTGNVG